MRVYYLQDDYGTEKHRIVRVWSEFVEIPMPEDPSGVAINLPYSVLELDERYNRWLARHLLRNNRGFDPEGEQIPDRYYVDNNDKLRDEFDNLVTVNPNPQREAYKLSQLYGLTQQQLENYIDNNVTNLAEARNFIKKLSAVVLWLVKQTKLDE